MAGSSMSFQYDNGADREGLRAGIRTVIATWTSDNSTGAVSGTTGKIVGRLLKGVTVPGAGGVAPTDNYDIDITDADSNNVLSSCKVGLHDRDTANTEETHFLILNSDSSALSMAVHPPVCSTLTIAVTNAGNSKQGTLTLYYAPY